MNTQPATRTFHCTEAGSSKFWTIATAADGKSFTVTFGKIGAAGQSKEKSFPTADACAKEAAKLIREKTAKGYIEQTVAIPVPAGKPVAPKKSAKPITPLPPYNASDIPQTRAFLRAIRAGKLDLVRAYLDAGADAAQRIKENQRTDAYPIHAAALANHPDVLRELISRATHYRTKFGLGLRLYTILPHIACLEDDIDRAAAVRLLLDCGYDVARDSESILAHYTNMRLPGPLLAEILKRTSLETDKGNYFYLAFDHTQKYHDSIRAAAPGRAIALIDRGIKIKATPDTDSYLLNDFGSPLHLALTYAGENHALIKKLIDAGADLAVKNTKQIVTGGNALRHTPQTLTPLELAESGTIKVSADVLALLRKHTAPTPGDIALSKLDPRDKRLLVLCQTPFETSPDPLKQVAEIRALLKDGANPNTRDANGLAPLHHLAAQNHYNHTLALLGDFITAGADIGARDTEGRTPIFHIHAGYAGILSLYRNFIAAGADINARDNHHRTPPLHRIHASAGNDQESINDTLRTHLAAGADPRLSTPDGDTMLHHAVRADIGFEAGELITAALDKGADINAKNKNGLTPLHVAVSVAENDRARSHDDIIRALLDAGADINAQTAGDDTAIHLAAHPDDDYEILLAARPNLTLKNKKGITALDHIKARGYYEPAGHRSLTRAIDALIAAAKNPAATATPPPAIAWTPNTIDTAAPLPAQLRITSSLVIENNDAGISLTYLGGNLLGLAGDKPSGLATIDIIDTAAGKVIWRMDGYENYRQPAPIHDDTAIYLPRHTAGSHSLTAHKRDTGEQLWQCKLGNSRMQFADGLVQTPTRIIHANPDTGKLYIIDKKTGKLLARAPLANPFGEWDDSCLFTADGRLYARAIQKKRTRVLDEYDPATGAHKRTLADLGDAGIEAAHTRDGHLYLLDHAGALRKINLATGALEKTTKAFPGHDGDIRCSRHLNPSPDGKLHYFLLASTGDDNPFVYCTYDLATDRVTTHDLSRMDATIARHHSRATTHNTRLLRIDKHGKPAPVIQLFDAAKCIPIATLELPNYGGDTRIEHIHHIGDAIYIAQRAGHDHGKDNTILHRVQ